MTTHMKTWSVIVVLLAGLGIPASSGAAERPLRVVATLSTFADLAKTIGGEQVDVTAIASPTFNPHFIEPKPSDVLKVKRADLFLHAGLDLELWRRPLLDAAGNTAVFPGGPGELDLSQGIELLEVPRGPVSRSQGDIHLYGNPHYWISPDNAAIMARTICDKLCLVDPAHEQAYRLRLEEFAARLEQCIAEWRARLAPCHGRELVGYHNEWPYLMRFAGLRMEHYLEPKPGIPPTPRQLEFLERTMRERRIAGIVQAGYAPRQAAEALAKRAGARVLQLCQSVGERPSCSDYVAMTGYNVDQLLSAWALQ